MQNMSVVYKGLMPALHGYSEILIANTVFALRKRFARIYWETYSSEYLQNAGGIISHHPQTIRCHL